MISSKTNSSWLEFTSHIAIKWHVGITATKGHVGIKEPEKR